MFYQYEYEKRKDCRSWKLNLMQRDKSSSTFFSPHQNTEILACFWIKSKLFFFPQTHVYKYKVDLITCRHLQEEDSHRFSETPRYESLKLFLQPSQRIVSKLRDLGRTLSSSRVKPRPARTLVWYLRVGHLTCGLKGPATGRGATRRAFAWRAFRLGKAN